MNLRGHKTKVVRLRADQLKVHPVAQRALVPANIKRIINTFNLDAIHTFAAVQYPIKGDNGPWIVDGQHRLHALMHHDFGEWMCDVKVFIDITDDAGASRLFLELNKRAVVRTYDAYTQELVAGDPVSVGVAALLRKHHLKLGASKSDGNVVCIHALKKVFAIDGGQSLDGTLGIILNAWGSKSAATEGSVIEGLGLVISRYATVIDTATLTKKLAKFHGGPSGLIGAAGAFKQHRKTSVPRCIAEIVIDTYNAGRRANKLSQL